jgi:predicted transcriptional regulator
MTREQLDALFDRVRSWPTDRQEEAAGILLSLEAEGEEVYRPTPEQGAELEEALREIDRGEVASEEEVRSAFRHQR